MGCTNDGVQPSQDLVQDELSPERPRTRSQVQNMAHLLQETQTAATGFKGQNMPDFVHLIT